MELLWDLLRELGILKKKRPGEPKKKGPPPPVEELPADPAAGARKAIEKQDPAELARALKRMMKDK